MTSTQWQLAREAAERYERILVPAILGPAARALVEHAALRYGQTVLDVGCGTGAAALWAAVRVGTGGRVIGVDVNAGMIDVARSLARPQGAAVEWHEGSAYDLPLPNHSVDVVLCAQTLQFLSERRPALVEMYRVTRPGGRLALSVWCDIRENPYFEALVVAMAQHVGRETAAGLGAAFHLTDEAEIRELLTAAGWHEVDVAPRQLELDLPPPQRFVPAHVGATPMAPGFAAAPASTRQAVVDEVSERLAAYATRAGVRVPFATYLATGRK